MRELHRRLSLRHQLVLSPVVASLSMLLVIGGGVLLGSIYGRILTDLDRRLYPTQRLVVEIEQDFQSFQQMLQDAAAEADVDLLNEAQTRSSEMRSTIRDGIASGLRPPREHAGIEESIDRHADLATSVTKQILRDGYGSVSRKNLTNLGVAYSEVVETLERWKAVTNSQIHESFAYLQLLRRWLVWGMIGVGSIATALMFWLANEINRTISEPIGAVIDLANRASDGDLTVASFAAIAESTHDDGVGRLRAAIVAMVEGLSGIVNEAKSTGESINTATGDLSCANEILQKSAEHQRAGLAGLESILGDSDRSQGDVRRHADSLSVLAQDSSASLVELDKLIHSTDELAGLQSNGVDELASTVMELASATEQSSVNAQLLRTATDSTETALAVLQAAEQKTRRAAKTTHEASNRVYDQATDGLQCVEKSSDNLKMLSGEFESLSCVVEGLGQSSKSIEGVVDILESIVGDTTLLALNASIVAAQAGGRGGAFSVVADAVRTLANRASESTREIRDLLGAVQEQIKGTVESTDRGREFVLSSLAHSEQERVVLSVVLDSARLSVEQMDSLVAVSDDQKLLLDTVSESGDQVRNVAAELAAATQEQRGTADRARICSEETRDRAISMRDALSRANVASARIAAASHDVAERSRQILEHLSEQKEQVVNARRSVSDLNGEAEVGAKAGSDLTALVSQLEEQSESLEQITNRFSIDDRD